MKTARAIPGERAPCLEIRLPTLQAMGLVEQRKDVLERRRREEEREKRKDQRREMKGEKRREEREGVRGGGNVFRVEKGQ